MDIHFNFYIIGVFFGFFAMMNPITNTPIFLTLTKGMNSTNKRRVALKSTLVTFSVIFIFCLFGKYLFNLFGITLTAFRLTGGVLIFLIGMDLLNGRSSTIQQSETGSGKDENAFMSIAISPLAVPLMAGPGTIATAMNFVGNSSLRHLIATIIAFGVLCTITYFMFVSGEKFVRYIGENTMDLIGRLMGLILAVMGTQMLLLGILDAIKYFSNA